MKFDDYIAFIGAVSPIVAAVVSFFTARYTTRKELRKLELQWNRDDIVSEKRDFTEMVSAVSRYLNSRWTKHQREAIEKIAIMQAQQHDALLDNLAEAIFNGDTNHAKHLLQNLIKANNSMLSEHKEPLRKKHKQ